VRDCQLRARASGGAESGFSRWCRIRRCFAPELPTLCVGLRGMIYTEIEVRGARNRSALGMYGGAAPNPFVALAQIIAGLKDAKERF